MASIGTAHHDQNRPRSIAKIMGLDSLIAAAELQSAVQEHQMRLLQNERKSDYDSHIMQNFLVESEAPSSPFASMPQSTGWRVINDISNQAHEACSDLSSLYNEYSTTRCVSYESTDFSTLRLTEPATVSPNKFDRPSQQLPQLQPAERIKDSNDEDDIVTIVNENDVLCGRGGETNHHTGNIRYRALVKQYQHEYLDAKRRDKPRIARRIVDTIRSRNPPGRFLKKVSTDDTFLGWKDVGNGKAREKTSQALREGAPELQKDLNGEEFCNLFSSSSSDLVVDDTRNISSTLLSMNVKSNPLEPEARIQNGDAAVTSPYPREVSTSGYDWLNEDPQDCHSGVNNSLMKNKRNLSSCGQLQQRVPDACASLFQKLDCHDDLTTLSERLLKRSRTSNESERQPAHHSSSVSAFTAVPTVNDDGAQDDYQTDTTLCLAPPVASPSGSDTTISPHQVGPKSHRKLRGPRLLVLKARMSAPSFLTVPHAQ